MRKNEQKKNCRNMLIEINEAVFWGVFVNVYRGVQHNVCKRYKQRLEIAEKNNFSFHFLPSPATAQR